MSEVARVPQLRFPEFSNEWEKNKLGNLAVIKSGISPSKYELKTTGSLPFLKVEDLNNCRKYQFNSRVYSESLKNSINKNSVIFPKRGAAIRLNKVRINKVAALMDSNLMALLPNTELLNTEFLYYKIMLDGLYKIADTSTIPQINNKHILPYKLNLPILPEQQKIAAFLTAVDNKIEQLSKKQELLGEYKKGLTQQIFSQAIRFKAGDGSDFPDWKEKKLENVLKRTSTGLNPRQNFKLGYGENYYVTIKNISNGKLDFSKCERIDENAMTMIANRSDLSKGDLIMSSIGNVGESYLLDKEPENWNINESVFMLRASELMLPQFLYFIITNEQSKWYLESNSTGSSFKSIKLGELKLLPLGLPSLEEQTKIANFLSSIDTKIEQVGKQLDESKQFKKALLQQMFV